MPLRSRREESIELNLTPMIDVLFLLIMFFMVGARFTESAQDIELRLPSVSQETPVTSAPQPIVIAIGQQGDIRLSGEPVASGELTERLRQSVAQQPSATLAIQGDAGVAFQHVAQVMAACRSAGIQDMAISVNLNAK